MGLRSIYSTSLYKNSIPVLESLFRLDFSCDGSSENDRILSFMAQNATWPPKEAEQIQTFYAGLTAYHKGKVTIRWSIIFFLF